MDLDEILYDGLNEQGFIFQEKCADIIKEYSGNTGWRLHTSEHPISLKDKDVRIDIIIRDETIQGASLYGVIECKKVNPHYNCWLFGRSLYDGPVPVKAQIVKIAKSTTRRSRIPHFKLVPIRHLFKLDSLYIDNWWVEANIRADVRGKRTDPEPLERTFIQVCRGLGGLLIEQLRQRIKIVKDGATEFYDVMSDAFFVPIVITTAALYVASYDLLNVDISTGDLERNDVRFDGLSEPLKWVMVDYAVPPSIMPDELYESFEGLDPVDLEPYDHRSIFVVNSRFVPKFLSNLHLEQVAQAQHQ